MTQKQMQDLEMHSIHNVGIPSLVLMERAALAVTEQVKNYVDKSEPVVVICGKGNNGADGVAVGRLLLQLGYGVSIVTIGNVDKSSKEYQVQENIAKNMGMYFCDWQEWEPTQSEWIIDGIFGIGLSRTIEGEYEELIRKIENTYNDQIISIDIPSGISADTGKILGVAIKARYTVTFGYEKAGLYLNQGRRYSGEIHVAEIGFSGESVEQVTGGTSSIIEEIDLCKIPSRREDGNKGTFGKVLVIAGSVGMSGAAYLCAAAAYRMGAGLVKILTVEENRQILQMQLPEAIVRGYTEDDVEEIVKEECQWCTSVIIGPGLGQGAYVKTLIKTVLKEIFVSSVRCPIVIDSDALNTIANYPKLEKYYGPHIIITPHMKEMSRLTQTTIEELKADPISQARKYSKKHKITCILKDFVSVITNEREETYLTINGNSALAKGGTGDVLTGIIGGLTCIGLSGIDAGAFGSYLHGRAGSLASQKCGKHGVIASELLEYLDI